MRCETCGACASGGQPLQHRWNCKAAPKQFGYKNQSQYPREKKASGLKPKDLVGIPWRTALMRTIARMRGEDSRDDAPFGQVVLRSRRRP